jgi:phosphotransacetylase
MPCTLDAAALAKMSDADRSRGASVDGPFCAGQRRFRRGGEDEGESGRPSAGNADILLVPNIECGNLVGKVMTYLAKERAPAWFWARANLSS